MTTHVTSIVRAALLLFLGTMVSVNVAFAHDDGTDHLHSETEPTNSAGISVEALPVEVVVDPDTGRPLPAGEAQRYIDAKTKAQNVQNQIKDVRTNAADAVKKVRTNAAEKIDATQERIQTVRASTTKRIEEARMEIKERLGNATSSIKQRFEEKRTQISAAAYERAKAFLERVIRQLTAALERLTKITDRIEERIVKLKEMGADTTAAEAGLSSSREKLVDAEAAIGLAASSLASAPSTTSTETATDDRVRLGEVRDLIKAAQDALKAVRESLRDLLVLVREAAGTLPTSTDSSDALEN